MLPVRGLALPAAMGVPRTPLRGLADLSTCRALPKKLATRLPPGAVLALPWQALRRVSGLPCLKSLPASKAMMFVHPLRIRRNSGKAIATGHLHDSLGHRVNPYKTM